MIRPAVLIFLLFPAFAGSFSYLHGQEMLGVVNSNYSIVNGMLINPANASMNKHKLNINILAGDFFINSNYIFVNKKDYNFFKLFSLHPDDPKYMHIYDYPEYFYVDTVHYFDYFKNTESRRMYMNTRVAGPSVTLRIGPHAISLVTGFRNNFSGTRIPFDVANLIFRGQDFEPQHNITYDHGKFTFAALSWIEVGIGYAYSFSLSDEQRLDIGITAKGLLGTGGAYGIVKDVNYMVPNNDSIYFNRMNATVGLDLPMDYATNAIVLNPLIRGSGFGGDIGINYIYSGGYTPPALSSIAKNQELEEAYLFRIGISLLDAGWITFNKMVQVHEFNDVSNRLWSGLSTFETGSIQHFLRSASQNLLGDSTASLTSQTSFRIFLPTATSLQLDYNIGWNVFVNATFVQGIPLGSPSVRRPALLAITPRFETSLYEINLPVSLLDFRDPAIGLAFRIYGLVIGTEKLGTFLHLTDVKGLDLYFSLGFTLDPKGKPPRSGRSRGAPCEAYPDYRRYQKK